MHCAYCGAEFKRGERVFYYRFGIDPNPRPVSAECGAMVNVEEYLQENQGAPVVVTERIWAELKSLLRKANENG